MHYTSFKTFWNMGGRHNTFSFWYQCSRAPLSPGRSRRYRGRPRLTISSSSSAWCIIFHVRDKTKRLKTLEKVLCCLVPSCALHRMEVAECSRNNRRGSKIVRDCFFSPVYLADDADIRVASNSDCAPIGI